MLAGQIKPVSMLLLGDSVDRSTVWDVNSTAWAMNYVDVESVLNEHWRSAIKLPMLEMVHCTLNCTYPAIVIMSLFASL